MVYTIDKKKIVVGNYLSYMLLLFYERTKLVNYRINDLVRVLSVKNLLFTIIN